MRQPSWLQSYGKKSTKQSQPVTKPRVSGDAPVAPQAPATLVTDPQASPLEVSHNATDLDIPDTPPATAEGKPGRALVRSRDTSTLDSHALLTAGWADLVPGESAGPKPDIDVDHPTVSKQEKLGPEDSVLASGTAAAESTSDMLSNDQTASAESLTSVDRTEEKTVEEESVDTQSMKNDTSEGELTTNSTEDEPEINAVSESQQTVSSEDTSPDAKFPESTETTPQQVSTSLQEEQLQSENSTFTEVAQADPEPSPMSETETSDLSNTTTSEESAPIASWAQQADIGEPLYLPAKPSPQQEISAEDNSTVDPEIVLSQPPTNPESEITADPENNLAGETIPSEEKPEDTPDTSSVAEQVPVTPSETADGSENMIEDSSEEDASIASSNENLASPDVGEETPTETSVATDNPPREIPPSSDVPALARPVAEPPDQTPTLAIDPASFRGIYPGKSTREELEASWGKGEPFTRDDGSTGLLWNIEPFEGIEVVIDGESVGSILIKLAEPTETAQLAESLEISDIRTVSVLDEAGNSIGEVYPERGVIFSIDPESQLAQAVILEPLDPESFVLRAEGELSSNSAFATADLQYAIKIDSTHLRALRLLLALRCEQGKWNDALTLATQAEAIDPDDIWTRLKHASVLMALEQTEAAKEKVEAVRDQPKTSPLVFAQAERMLARIELVSPEPDYQDVVQHFSEAIRTASGLLTIKSIPARNAARDVLLDAHLGTALAIAKGTWQQKSRVIPKWISRTEKIINEAQITDDLEKHTLELQMCRGALSVAAGSTETFDPLPWVKRLLQVRSKLDDSVSDPWRRRQIDWEVGEGLSDALVATQKRGDASDMLENTTLTAAYLERGSEFRQLTNSDRKKFGSLLFQIGILYSLQKGDHATAVTWFDKALPMWESNQTFRGEGEIGQLGESLVSMAISYWQIDRREDALAINRKGVELMVEAVASEQLDEQALAVAYGNLSTMYAEEGDDAQAQSFADLASRAEATGSIRK